MRVLYVLCLTVVLALCPAQHVAASDGNPLGGEASQDEVQAKVLAAVKRKDVDGLFVALSHHRDVTLAPALVDRLATLLRENDDPGVGELARLAIRGVSPAAKEAIPRYVERLNAQDANQRAVAAIVGALLSDQNGKAFIAE